MSLQAMAWAFEQKVKPTSKLVLLALSDYCADDGTCWQTLAQIGTRTGLSESTVRSALREMGASGLVEVVARFSDRGVQIPNGYVVLFDGRYLVEPTHREPAPTPQKSDTYPPAAGPLIEDLPKRNSSSSRSKTEENTNTKNPPTPHGPLKGFDSPFSSKRFSDALAVWLRHRAEKRKPLRPNTAAWSALRRKLVEMGEGRAIAAIEHSVANDYQGLYEPKNGHGNGGKSQSGAGWAGGPQKWTKEELRLMGELPEGEEVAH